MMTVSNPEHPTKDVRLLKKPNDGGEGWVGHTLQAVGACSGLLTLEACGKCQASRVPTACLTCAKKASPKLADTLMAFIMPVSK